MKSQLNKYRRYTISDYLINTTKFKDYLNFCLEHNLKNEKKYLMDNILRNLQLKENSEKPKILTELRKLSTLIIIFSDFEVELLFQMNYLIFNPESQKKIFLEVQDYLNKNTDEKINSDIKRYINNKYYFWMLKLANQNFSSVNEIKETILIDKEVKESVDNLFKYLSEINSNNFETKKQNEQSFIIKIHYELSLYFYFKNEHNKAYKLLISLVNYYDKYINKYASDIKNNEKKIFYFDIKNVKELIKYYEINDNQSENMYIDLNENDKNNNIFNEEDIINFENIITEDLNKYKNEIDNTKKSFKEKLQISNSTSLKEIDYNNKNCINTFMNCLKISEFLCYNSTEDYSYYKYAYDYINTFQNKLDEKIKINNNRKDDNDLQYIKGEIFFLIGLLFLIDKVNSKKDKLDKTFFNNLANFISTKRLTSNLRLSGLLHSFIINFSHNVKRICSYFSGFVEFFADKSLHYNEETINQIVFIDKIMKIIHDIMDKKNEPNFSLEKGATITFDESFHLQLINIFLFWLSPKEDLSGAEDQKKLTNKKPKKKILNFLPTNNILFILIESLQNWEFLKIIKIIYSNVLKTIINYKYLKNLDFNSDLLENIYLTKAKIFKVNTLFDDVIKGLKLIVDEIIYDANIQLVFKEKEKKEEYEIKEENINLYIKTLFNLIIKIENKIQKIENNMQSKEKQNKSINDIINIKKNNFLFSYFYSKEIILAKNNTEIKTAIINGIDFFNYSINNFRINYMKLDLMNDNIKLKKHYDTFKLIIEQDALYQIIICFIKEKKFLESIILIQYSKKFDKKLAFKLLKNMFEKNDFINFDNLKFIWKISLFEYLANYYSQNNNFEAVNKINTLIKRISNHQYFKGHSIRKHFKIMNFFNFLDYLNNTKYNI